MNKTQRLLEKQITAQGYKLAKLLTEEDYGRASWTHGYISGLQQAIAVIEAAKLGAYPDKK